MSKFEGKNRWLFHVISYVKRVEKGIITFRNTFFYHFQIYNRTILYVKPQKKKFEFSEKIVLKIFESSSDDFAILVVFLL